MTSPKARRHQPPTTQEQQQDQPRQQADSPGSERPRKRQRCGEAEASPDARGRATTFVDAPPRLLCGVCGDVFSSPRIVHGCGHECCLACLEASVGRARCCPLCDQRVPDANSGSTPFRRLRDEVEQLQARCQFAEHGCEAIVRVSDMESHCATCPHARVPCTHEDVGCKFRGTRDQLAAHLPACVFERMHDFVSSTRQRLSRVEQDNSRLEADLARLRVLERVSLARAERIRRVLRQEHQPTPGDAVPVQVVRVVDADGPVAWWFKVRSRGDLGPVLQFLESQRQWPIVVSCDGPLGLGGTPVLHGHSLEQLGLEGQPNVTLFAQPL